MSKVYCSDCKHYDYHDGECDHPDNWVWVDYHDRRRLHRKWWSGHKNKHNDCEFYEQERKKSFFWWRDR